MKVYCDVEHTTLENEDGYEVDGTTATCNRCDHTTESFGTSPSSARRCLVLLKEECPNKENNFYIDADDCDVTR